MQKTFSWTALLPIYALLFSGCLIFVLLGSRAVTVISEAAPLKNRVCIIIDAGHGGIDGGATSCTGVLESNINLQIALRLDDLFHFLGYSTKMIRTTDESIYTQGETIGAKKVSDLKERVRIVNETDNGLLISIHQNYFSDGRYSGAQVFYPNTDGSKDLAIQLQSAFVTYANPGSNRKVKSAHGIYLMEKIQCAGVLVECGFLSNPSEAEKLIKPSYQKQLCGIIVATVANYLES